MTMGIRVRLDTRDAQRRLERLGVVLRQKDLLLAVANRFLGWIAENFRKEGIERPWRPLSPNTVAGRRRGSSAILQDTGRLRASFTITQRSARSIEVGTNVTYAEHHETGTGPYTIRPRRATVLRFQTTAGIRFARIVHHPGLPQRKMLPTERLADTLARGLIEARVKKATREFNR